MLFDKIKFSSYYCRIGSLENTNGLNKFHCRIGSLNNTNGINRFYSSLDKKIK